MKDFDNQIIGNNSTLLYFEDVIKNNKMSHAYMITGPEKSGKTTLTKVVLSMLASNDSEKERIISLNSPDIIVIDKEDGKKSIGIEQIRDAIKDISYTPFEFNFKAYIIKNAECMTIQAQNSLLKSIEEPNDNVYFFLLTTNSSLLLQTINSRVQNIKTELFSFDDTCKLLKNKYTDNYSEKQIEFASKFSKGSLGKAIELLENDGMELSIFENVKKIFDGLLSKGINYNYFSLNRDISNTIVVNKKDKNETRTRFLMMLDFLLQGFRDILTKKYSSNIQLYFFDEDEITEYVFKFSTEDINAIISKITDLQYNTKYNYNVIVAMKSLTIDLWYTL